MGLRKIIKGKLYVLYLKKGMVKAIRELEDQSKRDQEYIAGAVEHINKSIGMIKDEVDLFLEAIDLVEAKYGKNSEAAEVATVFPFLALSMLDIFILFRQYMTTKDAIEKNFI